MSTWGHEFLFPDEWASEEFDGWTDEQLEERARTLGEALRLTPRWRFLWRRRFQRVQVAIAVEQHRREVLKAMHERWFAHPVQLRTHDS